VSTLPAPGPLQARSVWLDPATAVDLLTVAGPDGWLWERERAGFAGRGVALRIPVAGGLGAADAVVGAALAAIDIDDEVGVPGSGAVAVGALPFDRGAPLELIVPSMVVGRSPSGRCWLTTVGAHTDARSVVAALASEESRDPDGFALSSPLPHDEWMELVERAVAAIDAGRFAKVVVAREVVVDANRTIHVPTVLRRLRSLYPACTVVAAPLGGGEGQFVCASPELLVARHGTQVRSHPLAGTIPRSGDPHADQALSDSLLASPKDRAEHAWVVRDVVEGLQPWCTSLDVPATPSIVALRNVSHLGTLVSGTLAKGAPSALGLAEALHPTAAVGGTPRAAALEWLTVNERLERGPYAGPVGWVDGRGDGEWVVGIRSAAISGSAARLFAGVGVVEGSDPTAELAETQFKLQALLAAVVRP
jgi:menaquinone-specific isochorismate synthase